MITLIVFKSSARGMRYGIGTYIKQMTNSLLQYSDFKIVLVNYHSSDYKEFKLIDKSSRLKEIFVPSPRIGNGFETENEKYALRVVQLLNKTISNSINVVFQVNYLDALPIVRHLKTRFPFPIISVIHSAQWQFAFNGNIRKFVELWHNQNNSDASLVKIFNQERELYELSDKIVSVTSYMKDFILKYYNIPGEKVTIIQNGIAYKKVHSFNKKSKESFKQTLGFIKDEKIILFVGRLDQSKGLYYLLDALSLVISKYKNVRLVVTGEDSGTDKISQYLTHCKNIWGRVSFTGFLENEEVNNLYQVADIGVIPSLYDHCPYVVLEMMNYNIPLIMSNINGLNEILESNQCVFLTPQYGEKGNIFFEKQEIANAILKLLRNKSTIKRITSDYDNLISKRFSSEQMGHNMFSIISSLIH